MDRHASSSAPKTGIFQMQSLFVEPSGWACKTSGFVKGVVGLHTRQSSRMGVTEYWNPKHPPAVAAEVPPV
jgi:hypothetical protein